MKNSNKTKNNVKTPTLQKSWMNLSREELAKLTSTNACMYGKKTSNTGKLI
jgi:hypothetical protein